MESDPCYVHMAASRSDLQVGVFTVMMLQKGGLLDAARGKLKLSTETKGCGQTRNNFRHSTLSEPHRTSLENGNCIGAVVDNLNVSTKVWTGAFSSQTAAMPSDRCPYTIA